MRVSRVPAGAWAISVHADHMDAALRAAATGPRIAGRMTPSGWHGGARNSRREPRVSVDLPATLVARARRAARVVDLSLVGCLVRSEAPLDGGAVVDLQVELPDGALRTKARVAEASLDGDSPPDARQQFLSGLEFFGLAAADELRLRRFVAAEARRRSADPAPS
jgi:hypothetical protein